MFSLASAPPRLTEAIRMAPLTLKGRMPSTAATIDLDLTTLPNDQLHWSDGRHAPRARRSRQRAHPPYHHPPRLRPPRLRPPRHARPTVQPPARRVQPAPRSYTGSYGIVLASRQPLHQLAARCLHLHGVS